MSKKAIDKSNSDMGVSVATKQGARKVGARKVRRRKGSPGRSSPPNPQMQAIAGRLRDWYRARYKNQGAFADAIDVRENTVSGWLGSYPKAIDLVNLLKLAKAGISLDWLLTGEGPDVRGAMQASPALAKSLRGYVVASLSVGDLADYRALIERKVPQGDGLLRGLVEAERARITALVGDIEQELERDKHRAELRDLRRFRRSVEGAVPAEPSVASTSDEKTPLSAAELQDRMWRLWKVRDAVGELQRREGLRRDFDESGERWVASGFAPVEEGADGSRTP